MDLIAEVSNNVKADKGLAAITKSSERLSYDVEDDETDPIPECNLKLTLRDYQKQVNHTLELSTSSISCSCFISHGDSLFAGCVNKNPNRME